MLRRSESGGRNSFLISDPYFYLTAVPAVMIFGISKGGFGGGLGVAAVPLMALAVSPVQAAAILLPILCLMDLVSLWAYRGRWIASELRVLLPWSLAGIGGGTLMFGLMSPAIIRLMLGIIAVSFTLHHWLQATSRNGRTERVFPPRVGAVAAATAGFTSFVAHAGAPPINAYLLRRNLDRTEFVATTVVFFAVVNYAKLVPYAWLGSLDTANLSTSLILAPLAPAGVAIGVWMHNRINDRLFFQVAYILLFGVGLKLMYDGIIP